MAGLRILAFAAASGRVGHVFLRSGQLMDWGLSRMASMSPERAARHASRLIEKLKPDVVITEDVPKTSTKSQLTRSLIAAIARVAEEAKLLDIRTRTKTFANKYAEAAALAEQFAELRAWLPPRRRLWDPEPQNTVIFEALALALIVVNVPAH